MSEMIERVAKAISEADEYGCIYEHVMNKGIGRDAGCSTAEQGELMVCRALARAALEAMREPTAAMVEGWFNGEADYADHPCEFHLNVTRYRAMIAAALGETK